MSDTPPVDPAPDATLVDPNAPVDPAPVDPAPVDPAPADAPSDDQVIDDAPAADTPPAVAADPSPDSGFIGHQPDPVAVAPDEPVVQPVHPSDTAEVEARAAAAPEVVEETITVTEEVTETVTEPLAEPDPNQPQE